MKRILFSMLAMLVALVLVTPAQATLITRGTGTSTHGTYNLIYDDDLDITWYDFSNAPDQWQDQVDWAGGLSVDFGGDIFDDWRLPTTVDGTAVGNTNPSFYNGTGPNGYNITTSEMGHLFYTGLDNKGYYATDGTNPQLGWDFGNTGDFQNLIPSVYWSGTEFASNPLNAWHFSLMLGGQDTLNKDLNRYALAVRSGNVGDLII